MLLVHPQGSSATEFHRVPAKLCTARSSLPRRWEKAKHTYSRRRQVNQLLSKHLILPTNSLRQLLLPFEGLVSRRMMANHSKGRLPTKYKSKSGVMCQRLAVSHGGHSLLSGNQGTNIQTFFFLRQRATKVENIHPQFVPIKSLPGKLFLSTAPFCDTRISVLLYQCITGHTTDSFFMHRVWTE